MTHDTQSAQIPSPSVSFADFKQVILAGQLLKVAQNYHRSFEINVLISVNKFKGERN